VSRRSDPIEFGAPLRGVHGVVGRVVQGRIFVVFGRFPGFTFTFARLDHFVSVGLYFLKLLLLMLLRMVMRRIWRCVTLCNVIKK